MKKPLSNLWVNKLSVTGRYDFYYREERYNEKQMETGIWNSNSIVIIIGGISYNSYIRIHTFKLSGNETERVSKYSLLSER